MTPALPELRLCRTLWLRDRGLCWSFGDGACCIGTEANVTEKGGPSKVQGGGAWYRLVNQPVLVLC